MDGPLEEDAMRVVDAVLMERRLSPSSPGRAAV
jgi:hypothetical protein